jgi:hypothetical protein
MYGTTCTLAVLLASATPSRDDVVERLDRYLQSFHASTPLPGFSVVVVREGATVFARGYGVEVAGQERPFTSDSSSGIGSLASARVDTAVLPRRIWPLMLVLAFGLCSVVPMAHHYFLTSGSWPWALRALALFAISLIAGGLMGLPFATLMRVVGTRYADSQTEEGGASLLPWLWGLNGMAGVLASVIVMYVAVFGGHSAAMYVGAGCYVIVAAGFWSLSRAAQTR